MADGDFNLATLWLPVAPETSKLGPAMEQAGKDSKKKFTDNVKGIGDVIHDDLSKASGKVKDTFTGVGKSITDILAKTGADSSKSLAESFGADTGPLRTLVDTTNQARTGVQNLGKAFVDLKSGNVNSALDNANKSLQNIDDSAKKAGFDLKDLGVPQEATDSLSKLNDTSGSLSQHLEEAKGGVERLGQSGGGLSGLISKLGEVGVIAASVKEALNDIKNADHWLEDRMPWYKSMDEDFKNNPLNSWFKETFGGDDKPKDSSTPYFDAQGRPLNSSGQPFGGPGGPAPSATPHTPYPTTQPPGSAPRNFYKDWYGPSADTSDSEPAPSSSRSSSRISGSSSIGSPTSRTDLHAAGSRVAYLYALAKSLEGTPYSQDLRNDCSGMVSQLAAAALGMPPPSAGDRFTTVNEGDWLMSHGFKSGIGPEGSFQVGWYDHGGGNNGHTAATLPGGEHAESGGSHNNFHVGAGSAGADNSEFEHHAYLPMDGLGGGSGPAGSKADPVFVSQADTGSGSGSSTFESQGQQLGQGLVNGVLQMFGLDGSVFGGKSPLDWGAVKLGGGLLNYGMGVAKQRESYAAAGGTFSGGGGGGALGGLTGMIPSPGAAMSAAAQPAGGSRGIGAAVGAAPPPGSVHYDMSTHVSDNNFRDSAALVQKVQEQQNSRLHTVSGGLPAPSIGAP